MPAGHRGVFLHMDISPTFTNVSLVRDFYIIVDRIRSVEMSTTPGTHATRTEEVSSMIAGSHFTKLSAEEET